MAESLRQRSAVLRDLMNANVVTTTPDATVTEAAASMVRARVGSAVVMQGSFLAGILTERDVLRAAASPISSTLPAAGGVPVPPILSQPPTMGPGRTFGLRSPSRRSRAHSRSRSGRSGAGARRRPIPIPMPTLACPSAPGKSQP